jgi:CobQ-like glutamine amidotransferase family enzyme
MTTSASIRIGHLYPARMNIYGDRGNILTLIRRCEWRGIEAAVDRIEVGDRLTAGHYDLIFFGGGQDQEQETVAADLQTKGAVLKEAVAGGTAVLAVCGGYQLLGNYYQPDESTRLEGVGVFPVCTDAGDKRMIGNVVAIPAVGALGSRPLVGFENHSGRTFLEEGATPLGVVSSGFGNNGADRTEGCVIQSAVGTYLHGSLLPKNPHLADWLISAALRHAGAAPDLEPLEDELELAANASTARRFT